MNTELRNWTKETIASIRNSIERMNNNTLSESSRNSFAVMLVQLSQEIQKDPEYDSEPGMHEIADRFLLAFGDLVNNDVISMQKHYDELVQLSMYGEIIGVVTEEDRQKYKPREDGRTYIDLPQMPREQFMQYVEHLKSIGAKFDKEAKQWYVEKDWQLPEKEAEVSSVPEKENIDRQEKESTTMSELKINFKELAESISDVLAQQDTAMGKAQTLLEHAEQDRDLFSLNERNFIVNYGYKTKNFDKVIDLMNNLVNADNESSRYKVALVAENEIDKINEVEFERFKAIYYVESDRREIYASTIEAAIQAVRDTLSEVSELKGNERCYIQEYHVDTGKYNEEGIYTISSGRDVTPVEINIPPMDQEAFKEVTKRIKEMGAKFDGQKKIWYVERSTQDDTVANIKRFIDSHDKNIYLPLPYMSSETYKEVREGLKELGAKFNGDKKMWYAATSTSQDAIDKMILFIDNHDEGIYLKLPAMEEKQFKETIAQLRKDGARFSPTREAWYITDKQDKSKFISYLPSEKPSVLGKLEQNKEYAAKSNQEKEKTMEPRNKDNHERA